MSVWRKEKRLQVYKGGMMGSLNKEILKYVILKLAEEEIPPARIVVQKIMFYFKESGVPISYSYAPYAYGPYSKELGSDANELVLLDQLESNGFKYSVGQKFSYNLTEDYKVFIDKKINEFKSHVDNYSFNFMELFGTTLYCIRSLEEMGTEPNEEKVLSEFKTWKGNKYSEKSVIKMFNSLRPGVA